MFWETKSILNGMIVSMDGIAYIEQARVFSASRNTSAKSSDCKCS
jgi:hypothetical protein